MARRRPIRPYFPSAPGMASSWRFDLRVLDETAAAGVGTGGAEDDAGQSDAPLLSGTAAPAPFRIVSVEEFERRVESPPNHDPTFRCRVVTGDRLPDDFDDA